MTDIQVFQVFSTPLSKGGILFGRSNTYTDVANINPTHFFWDDTNYRLGLGTVAPGAKLDVRGTVIFNEDGGDNDVRMEGNAEANLFFLDASTDRIGIGTATPGAKLDVRGPAIFNEDGASVDFRIEGNTKQNLFFVDGSADKIGIGTNSPGQILDVVGDLACTTLWGQGQLQIANDLLYIGSSTADTNFFIDRPGAGGQFIFNYNTPQKTGATAAGVFQIFDNSTNRYFLIKCVSAAVSGGQAEVTVNDSQQDIDFRWETNAGANGLTCDAANANVTINAASISAHYDLALAGDGVLCLKETTTPTADTNYGKIYTKNTNKIFFQDGAGSEKELLSGVTGAPIGSQYWVSTADATLTAEVNLGALTTGLLKHSVSAGTSTPATASAGTDYYSQDSHVDHDQTTNYDANKHMDTTGWAADLIPDGDGTRDLGAVGGTDYRWKDFYLSGNLSDETNSLTVANAKAAYDHVFNNGSDHSFINQSVISGSSPSFTSAALTTPVLTTSVSGTAFKDEDDMASDGAALLASQQSIKAYVDTDGGSLGGWTNPSETWTYASATTFTISGDVTAKYPKGTKLKLTQTTVKYFYVIATSYSDPNTTITVTGGTDYSLANASITSPFYSYLACPQGHPIWFGYTPTYAGSVSMTYTSVTTQYGEFALVGAVCNFKLRAYGTTGGTASTYVTATLPVTSANAYAQHSACAILDTKVMAGFTWDQDTTAVQIYRYDNVNWSLGANKYVTLQIVYEI